MVMDIFDTNVLVQVVPNLKLAQNFLLDTCFPNIVCSDSEFVSIDVDIGKRRVAPFVSPLVEGKLVEQRRIQTNTFKPAYIKDKRVPDLLRPVRRQIGERIGGELKGEERMMANLMFEMADQVDMVNRRLELMAASALTSGSLTVSGDGFPTTVIDYGRDAALTVTLTSTNVWDYGVGSTATPANNIQTWANLILKKSGAVATKLIFSPTTYSLFKADPIVRDAIVLDTARFRRNTGNDAKLAPEIKHGAAYMGNWGSFELYVYNDWYVDDNNVEQRMLADNLVLVVSEQMMGTRAFGQIMDPAFNYGPLPYAPKSWLQEDPAQRFILMQSSPLVIPSRVNTVLAATVCTAVNT